MPSLPCYEIDILHVMLSCKKGCTYLVGVHSGTPIFFYLKQTLSVEQIDKISCCTKLSLAHIYFIYVLYFAHSVATEHHKSSIQKIQ